MTFKFEFSDNSLLSKNLKLNFYDENKKFLSGMGLSIDSNGFVNLPQTHINYISYFPYSLLVKDGASNVATVLITNKEIFTRCLDYKEKPEPNNILTFNIDIKTGIVNTKFMEEKNMDQTRENTKPTPPKNKKLSLNLRATLCNCFII